MLPKSHAYKRCGTLRKKSYSARGYAEINIPFFDNKKTYTKLLYWKSKWSTYTLVLPLHMEIFIFEKHWNLNFGGISKFLKLMVFGQILAVLGSFGQIWANYAALTVVDSMPQLGLKS
jgi:hypothetical protein